MFFIAGIIHTMYMFFGYNWAAEPSHLATTHRAAGIIAVVLSAAIPFVGYRGGDDAGTFLVLCVLVTLVNSTSYMVRSLAARRRWLGSKKDKKTSSLNQ